MGETDDQEKANKELDKVNKETVDLKKAEEKTSDNDAEAKGDAIPTRNALAALSDSDDDFPAPVGADDSDKEDVEDGKSMEEKLKQKLREKEAEKRDEKSKEKEKAKKEKAEKVKAEQEKAVKEKIEKEKAEKIKAEQQKALKEEAAKEKIEKDK